MMREPTSPPQTGLPLGALAALRASAGLLPAETLAEGILANFHFGLLSGEEDAALLARIAADPVLAAQSAATRRRRDEWLRTRPPAERLELWPVDFWHDLDSPGATDHPDREDKALIDRLFSDAESILAPTGSLKFPKLRVQTGERSIELTAGAAGLDVKCVLGLGTDLGPLPDIQLRILIGGIAAEPGRIAAEGPLRIATARFAAAQAHAIADAAPQIRSLRLETVDQRNTAP